MCEPTTIMLAMAAASAALTVHTKEETARAINKQADNQHAAAVDTAVSNYTQLNRKAVEDQQNASVQQYGLQRETAARVATGRAQAGAAGVFGTSVDAVLLNLAGKGLEAQTTAEVNYARTVAANEDQANEIYRSAKYGVAGIQTAPGVGWADLLGAGLQIGSAYMATTKLDKPTAPSQPTAPAAPSAGIQ